MVIGERAHLLVDASRDMSAGWERVPNRWPQILDEVEDLCSRGAIRRSGHLVDVAHRAGIQAMHCAQVPTLDEWHQSVTTG